MNKTLRILLIVLNACLGISAIAGGFGMYSGVAAPPLELLEGSPFSSFNLPSAILALIGVQALLAAYWLIRQHQHALLDALVAGGGIILFTVVEILIFGSQPGFIRLLQVFHILLGAVIVTLALVLRRMERSRRD